MATRKSQHGRKPSRNTILVRFPAIRERDLAGIEKRLKVKLPPHYRRFMLSYPSVLIETRTDLGWCHESLSDRKLRINVDELIYFNEDVRKPGTPWTEDDGPWPERYFVVGDDQCGNYWVVDLTSAGREVLFYDHDFGKFQVVYKTVEAFAKDLVRSTKKWNREQQSRRTSRCT